MSESNLFDHYWLASDGRLYGSARGGLVAAPTSDADYLAWTAGGARLPTQWPRDATGAQTSDSLEEVLAPYGLHATLDAWKSDLKSRVDAQAESMRMSLITPGSGQAMEYQEAYAEAVQVSGTLKASPSATIDPATYPMLSASIGYDLDPTTGKATTDIAGEARAVLAAYDAYQKAGSAIRGARLQAKKAIDAATTVPAAIAARSAATWPALS